MKANKKKIYFITTILIFTIVFIYFIFIQKNPLNRIKQDAQDFNFIIISVDTLRADRIGCYGFSEISTPTIDMFAQQGVKFEKCIAPTPLTLPSHTSILTGTHPNFHGVRDNGGFLVPENITTLSELMKKNGFQTSAFVAAYVLDSKWGLDQGFDHYFDNFDLSQYKTISLGRVQRRGDEVIDEVIPWLESHKNQKFFSWIHLYDPHTPYEPPPPFSEKYPHRPYIGEIAYTDSLLNRLWDYLNKNDLIDNTIVVFTSDHGESLGEHKEMTHGFFVYQAGIHVPLIFVSPFKYIQGISRSSVVSLVDIMPTILELANIPIPDQVQGKSLVPMFFSENKKEQFAYSETFYPRFHYGWSELKSYQNESFKIILAPKFELYHLSKDPKELNNIIDSKPEETRRFMNLITDFIEEAGKGAYKMDYSHMDAESRQKLAALGYIGTFTDPSSLKGKELGDPKEKIRIFNQLSKARELGLKGEYDQAVNMIMEIINMDPDVIDAYSALGILYLRQEKLEKAVNTFQKVLEIKPDNNATVINLTNCYLQMGKLDKAEEFLMDKLDLFKKDFHIYFKLGNIKNSKKEYKEAEKYFNKCIELNPSSSSAYNALGGICITRDELDRAERYLKKAQKFNPKLKELHYHFALLFEAQGDFKAAESEYLKELENTPHNYRASYNLSHLYRIKGDVDKEMKYLKMTIDINPDFPLSYFYLGRIYLNQGINHEKAISLVKKGIELKPQKDKLPLGYFLLADLYYRIGDDVRYRKYLDLAEETQIEIKK